MKKSEIRVGGVYTAKVSNKLVKVRVDSIKEVAGYSRGYNQKVPDKTVYYVTNLTTGRTTTFRSAAKFRGEAKALTPVINLLGTDIGKEVTKDTSEGGMCCSCGGILPSGCRCEM